MTIRLRIMALTGMLVLVALAVTALAISTLSAYDRMMSDYDRAYENAFVGERLNNTVSKAVMASRGIYLSQTREESSQFADQLAAELDAMPALLQRWSEIVPAEQAGHVQKITETATAFIQTRREMVRLGHEGSVANAEQMGVSNRPFRIAFQNEISDAVDHARANLEVAKTEATAFRSQRTLHFLVATGIGIIIVAAGALWLTSRFITVPLQNIASAIVRTSEGDYHTKLTAPERDDEVAKVWHAISVLREKSQEAERLAAEEAEANRRKEMELRQIILD